MASLNHLLAALRAHVGIIGRETQRPAPVPEPLGDRFSTSTVAAMLVPQWHTNTPILCIVFPPYFLYLRNALAIGLLRQALVQHAPGFAPASGGSPPCLRTAARRTASMSAAGSTLRGQRSTQAKQLRQRVNASGIQKLVDAAILAPCRQTDADGSPSRHTPDRRRSICRTACTFWDSHRRCGRCRPSAF